MTPRRIIKAALGKGLHIIAIADHNSAENTVVAVRIGLDEGIIVLPSMELTSREEVHVLALFSSVENAVAMQEVVYDQLQEGCNDERSIGYQLVVNEFDEILDYNRRLLIGATGIPLGEMVNRIHSFDGMAVASHIDRGHFSVISQLGFIPMDIGFDALEISSAMESREATRQFGSYAGMPWVTSSDAHTLADVGRKTTTFLLNDPSFNEIAMAFKGERQIKWY